ncbi:MAG: hypothetical protein WBG86_14835 [Polyangiales bacterium]
MRSAGACLGLMFYVLATSASADAPVAPKGAASPRVIVVVTQGSDGIREAYTARVRRALAETLADRGYQVVDTASAGQALLECPGARCTSRVLEREGAGFGLVPAMWGRPGDRRELTLTLVGKSGRNLNAGTVLNGDLASTTAALVDQLLAEHGDHDRTADALPEPWMLATGGDAATRLEVTEENPVEATRGQAWKTGPILLWAGGAATLLSVGLVTGLRNDDQSIRPGALAAWVLVGVGAVGGGTAWWVVGKHRARREPSTSHATIRVSPRGFDLRVRF